MYIHTNHVSDISSLCNVCIYDTPMNSPVQWEELLLHPRWPDVVSRVFYINSVLDRDVSPDVSVGGFVCSTCTPPACFASSRALESHQRVKHGVRNSIRTYLDASAKCPSCHSQFGARVSLINHLSDKRRPKCKDWIVSHLQPLDSVTVAALDAVDNELKKTGLKAGRTHHIVGAPAMNQDVRTVGRASK